MNVYNSILLLGVTYKVILLSREWIVNYDTIIRGRNFISRALPSHKHNKHQGRFGIHCDICILPFLN